MTKQRVDYSQQIREHLSTAYLFSEEKINSVLPQVCTSLHSMISNLEQLAATDTKAISRAGHTLKGALLNLGLHELAEKAVIIEKNGQAGEDQYNCTRIIQELKEEIGKLP